MKLLGYILIAMASYLMYDLGYGIATPEWWIIIIGTITGTRLAAYGD